MTGSPDTVSPHGTAAAANEAIDPDELKAYLDWLRELAAAGGTLSKLVRLELRLAVGDGLRLVLLGLVMLSVVILAWTGFSVLMAWLAYLHGQSVISGLCAFLAMQLAALGAMWWLRRQYRKSLSLPVTRRHLDAFMEGARHGAQAAE